MSGSQSWVCVLVQVHSLVVYSAGGLCHVNLKAPVAPETKVKRVRGPTKPQQQLAVRSERGQNARVLLLENPCLFFGHTGEDAAVLVEKPWMDVLQQLPPPLYRHRYGS